MRLTLELFKAQKTQLFTCVCGKRGASGALETVMRLLGSKARAQLSRVQQNNFNNVVRNVCAIGASGGSPAKLKHNPNSFVFSYHWSTCL